MSERSAVAPLQPDHSFAVLWRDSLRELAGLPSRSSHEVSSRPECERRLVPEEGIESGAYGPAFAPAAGGRPGDRGCLEKFRPSSRREAPPAIGCTAPGGLDPKTGRPGIGRPGSRGASAGTTRLLNLHQAASYLGLSWWTTRELVMGGTIPAVRLPAPRATDGRMLRRILIDVADLDALIAKWKDRSV